MSIHRSSLFQLDQIRGSRPSETDLHDASMFTADVTSDSAVRLLQPGWLASTTGIIATSQTSIGQRSGPVDIDGVLGML